MKLNPVESGRTHLLVHCAALLLIDSLALRTEVFFINETHEEMMSNYDWLVVGVGK